MVAKPAAAALSDVPSAATATATATPAAAGLLAPCRSAAPAVVRLPRWQEAKEHRQGAPVLRCRRDGFGEGHVL